VILGFKTDFFRALWIDKPSDAAAVVVLLKSIFFAYYSLFFSVSNPLLLASLSLLLYGCTYVLVNAVFPDNIV
jgi:hypothetical protein